MINFGLTEEPGFQSKAVKQTYMIKGNNLKVSKNSKPLKRFENTIDNNNKNEEEVPEMPNSFGEVAAFSQQKLDINNTLLVTNGFSKRPYSAHGYKVTNTKVKFIKTKEINQDNFVNAYKEKILASDKDLFDFCFNIQQEDNKHCGNQQKKKKKLVRRYLQVTKPNNPNNKTGFTCDDDFNNDLKDENKEKITKTRQLIKENTKQYKYTNEILTELGKVAPSDDVNKLIVSMADNNETKEIDANKCKTEANEIEENVIYEQLNERIKKQIKEKGTYDFSKLSKQDRDLLLKKKIYSNTQDVKLLKEKTKIRPLTTKHIRNIKSTKEEPLPNKKKKKTFKNEPDHPFNEILDYIPKASMTGFLLKPFKNKSKRNISYYNNCNNNHQYYQFKAKRAPKFTKQLNTKEISHPLLANYGKD